MYHMKLSHMRQYWYSGLNHKLNCHSLRVFCCFLSPPRPRPSGIRKYFQAAQGNGGFSFFLPCWNSLLGGDRVMFHNFFALDGKFVPSLPPGMRLP